MIKVFFHKNCIDGNACILIMQKYFKDTPFEAHGISFGFDYKSIIANNVEKGDIVYFLDFSPIKSVLEGLLQKAERIYVIDHHVYENILKDDKIITYIDETHCASYNAFKYFYPDRDVPNILKYLDVTDLINTEALNYYEIAAFIRTLETDDLQKSIEDLEKYKNVELDFVISEGKEIFKQDYIKMEENLGEIYYRELGLSPDKWALFPLVYADIYTMGAEIDYKLKQLMDDPNSVGEIPHIACAFAKENDYVRVNIRSNPLYIDADKVASYIGENYGLARGGGHRKTAVARFSFEQFEKFFKIKIDQ